MYGPYLTADELKAKYPNSLVLLANPSLTRYHEVIGGHAILHATTREEFNRLYAAWDDPDVKLLANFYTGEIGSEEIIPPDAPAEPEVA